MLHRRPSHPRSRVPLYRRLLLDRRALRRWVVALAASVAVTVAVGRTLGRAEEVRARWGPTRSVLVTAEAVPAGRPLAPSVQAEPWPASLVPADALVQLPDGARAGRDLAAGAPVSAVDVAAADAATGRRRVAVPAGDARLPLAPGDRVDLWATFDPSLAEGGATTRRVATGAIVSAADGPVVVIEVDLGEVAPVAAALTTAAVVLAAAT